MNKTNYLNFTKLEQNAIDQWIDEHPVLTPYIIDTTPPAHIELVWEDIYVENGEVYYCQGYQWTGNERDEYDNLVDIYEPEDWIKVGTLKEMLESYTE